MRLQGEINERISLQIVKIKTVTTNFCRIHKNKHKLLYIYFH